MVLPSKPFLKFLPCIALYLKVLLYLNSWQCNSSRFTLHTCTYTSYTNMVICFAITCICKPKKCPVKKCPSCYIFLKKNQEDNISQSSMCFIPFSDFIIENYYLLDIFSRRTLLHPTHYSNFAIITFVRTFYYKY